LIIRTPVIPTFNDTVEEIGAIADFASSLEGVSEMHILPYHRMGTDKYVGLGREYLLPDLEPPTKEHMQKLLEVVQSKGLYGQIGG
jgi:pyruvate formate lyase activating enzyme